MEVISQTENYLRVKFEIGATLACLVAWIAFSLFKYRDDKLANSFYYVVPIIVPFVSFVFDRLRNLNAASRIQTLIDILILATSMWRVIGDVPYVSGHALFLTYAIATVSGRIRKLIAAAVLIEVLILKVFVWNDELTFAVGVGLALIAALIRFSARLRPTIGNRPNVFD